MDAAFFRGICPVSMSSPLCVKKSWNRAFHRLLSQMGLSIGTDSSIMKGWFSVFENEISANTSYMVCTIIWCVGIVGISLFTFLRQRKLYAELKNVQCVYGRVYQADGIEAPLIKGIFFDTVFSIKYEGK